MNLHLALVISSLGAGGAERIMSELANHWVKQGHNVSLITLASPEAIPFYKLDSRIQLIQLNQCQAETSMSKRLLNMYTRVASLRKAINNLQPNIVISFIDVMNITTLISCFGLGIPVAISERIDPHFHHIPKLYKALRILTYPYCKKLIVQTQSSKNYFPERFNKFISIIPNPVAYPKQHKQELNLKVTKLVTTGRLNQQKDHATLIRAFANLAMIDPALTLAIYGEGSERTKLEQLIDNLGLKDKVFLPGVIRNIEDMLIEGDLFIFPSKYEGFPNALCEAMAIGLPVIASNCSGNVDVIRDKIDGRLFPTGDVESLASICKELIEDHKQRQDLATNAQTVCSRFSADEVFSLWDSLLDEILSTSSLPIET